jgi:hypothetical protein
MVSIKRIIEMNIRIYLALATLGCVSISAHSSEKHTPPQKNTCEVAAIHQMWDRMREAGQMNSNNYPDTAEATKIALAFERAMEECKQTPQHGNKK